MVRTCYVATTRPVPEGVDAVKKNIITISSLKHRQLLLLFVLVPIDHPVDVIRPMLFVKPNGDGLFLD
jgi:hypothetical protein